MQFAVTGGGGQEPSIAVVTARAGFKGEPKRTNCSYRRKGLQGQPGHGAGKTDVARASIRNKTQHCSLSELVLSALGSL